LTGLRAFTPKEIKMPKKFRILVGGAALVAAVLVPASSASADSGCSTGYHCGWDIGFNTGKVAFFNSDPDFRNDSFNTGAVVDNNIKSAKNRTSTNYVSFYYYGVDYTGGLIFCVNPGSDVQNLPDDGVPGNGISEANEASSLRLVAGGPFSTCY
jgi:hypothetical protein